MVDPKGPSGGPSFGRVLRPQTVWRQRGGHAHFPAKNMIFFKKASKSWFLINKFFQILDLIFLSKTFKIGIKINNTVNFN